MKNNSLNNNFTQSGESSVPQEMRKTSDFLPDVINTSTNKKFLETTLDQLMSSGTTEPVDFYWGKVSGSTFVYGNDYYNQERNELRQNYQFAPGFTYNENGSDQVVSYINLINNLQNMGYSVNDIDRLYSAQGFTLDLPINQDMFINYVNYYWIDTEMVSCKIIPTSTNPITISDILNMPNYTTPMLDNGKTLTFMNGMRVSFDGDYLNVGTTDISKNAVYIVGGVGEKIYLTMEVDNVGKIVRPNIVSYTMQSPTTFGELGSTIFSYDETLYIPLNKEYIVIDPSSADANPWSRINRWLSGYAISAIATFNDMLFEQIAKSENKGKRPIIQFNANMELYNTGNRLIETVDHVIDCSNGLNPAIDIQNSNGYTYNNIPLVANELVMFINTNEDSQQSYYNNNIFVVKVIADKITLDKIPYVFSTYDKIVTKSSNTSAYIGSEFYWENNAWVYGQQKTSRGSAPLFKLYDDKGIYLKSYQNSNFYGDTIFTYVTSSASTVDTELGINAKTNSLSSTEYMFSLSEARYGMTLDTINYNSIEGYYYYKNVKNNKLYSIWKPIRNVQRVNAMKTIVASEDGLMVSADLGQNIDFTSQYIVSKEGTNYKWFTYDKVGIYSCGCKSEIQLLEKQKTYTITQLMEATDYITFYDPFGNVSSEISYSIDGNVITLNIAESYRFPSLFYRNSTNTINGIIYISNKSSAVFCYKNGQLLAGPISHITTELSEYFLTQTNSYMITENSLAANDYNIYNGILSLVAPLNKGDVIEIYYITDDSDVAHDVSPLFKYNTFNEEPSLMSYSNICSHINDQFIKNPSFVGNVNGNNNYHSIPKIHTFGGIIRQQPYTPAIHAVLSSRELSEPTNALKEVALDYANFKLYFSSKVKQLWNTNTWNSVQEIVDEALSQINIGKNEDFKYANSDMAYYGGGKNKTYSITTATTDFELYTEVHSRGYNNIPTYVWISEKVGTNYIKKILKNKVDYTINGKTLTLVYSPTYTINDPAILTIEQYVEPSCSFIPFSSVKLGFEQPYDVKINNDNLELHDGSFYNIGSSDIFDLYSSSFDIVGAALYELEMRILVNLPDIHYTIDNITAFAPKIQTYGSTISWNEFKSQITKEFYYWKNNINYGDKTVVVHNPSDQFTWNYSSVGDGIAGWRGIYLYNFGTIHPDLHPWEMLGHNTKPTWWDEHYSWTNLPKRANLIKSLKLGIHNDPSLTTSYPDPKFAITHYDWDANTLVTTAGVLNGPVDANVVPSPSVTVYANTFEYGDMMFDDEIAWMDTSEYSYSLIISLLKIIPAKIFETYSSIGGMIIHDNDSFYNLQYVYSDTKRRTNPTTKNIHSEIIGLSGISSIKILNSGSNYSNNTTVEAVISSTGERATFYPVIVDGAIVSVTITDPGFGYKTDIRLIITDPSNTGSGADIMGMISTTNNVYIMPGLLAAIVEYNNGIKTVNDIKTMISSIRFTPIVHLGGYSKKYNIDVKLDGSYHKGKVSLPKEDFQLILNKNPAINSKFYSGIRIEKTQTNSFRVWGYDVIDPVFRIYLPNIAGSSVSENIGTYSLKRYTKFKNIISEVQYGTEFIKRQDLYNFLLGMGQYYSNVGFNVDWNTAATEIIAWTLDSNITTDIFKNGIIDSTLIFEQGNHGIVDQFASYKNKIIKLLDKDARSVPAKDVLIIRNQTNTEITQKDKNIELYGVNIIVSEYEHVISINPVSQFGDIVYDNVLGIYQNRVKIIGERTRNWNGRIEANGYIISDNSIFGNFETSVREIERDIVNSQGRPLDKNISKTSRFNVGYVEPSYLSLLSSDDNTAYQFSIGERKNKGTQEALKAFTRNNDIFQGTALDYELSENWMVRLGDYGDKRKVQPIQVELDKSKIKINPQSIQLNAVVKRDRLDDTTIDISENDTNYISGSFTNPIGMLPIQTMDLGKNTLYTKAELSAIFEHNLSNAGLPLTSEITDTVRSVDEMRYVFDPAADYATIEQWTASKVYRQGDKVRLNGKVYELLVNSTQIRYNGDLLYARGNVSFPTVTSGNTLILGPSISELSTITFSKTGTQTVYSPIVVNGSIIDPVTNVNNTLIIDGKTIVLQKTNSSNIYEPIVYTASVSAPIFNGVSGKTLIIDGLTVDFYDIITTYQQIEALTGLTNAITAVKHVSSTAIPLILADARIQAFRNLAIEYGTAWPAFVDNYFSGDYTSVGMNFAAIVAEKILHPTYSELDALFVAELNILNAVLNTTYIQADWGITLTNSVVLPVINTIEENSIAGIEFDSFASTVKTAELVFSTTIIRTAVINYPKQWNIDLVVDKLNTAFVAAGKNRISASKTLLNSLAITKVAIAQDNSLVIGVGGANSDIGFPITTTTITSNAIIPSATIVTLSEIVGLINLAGISNVSANTVNTINGNILTITSTNPTLTISNATANSDIGLVANQYVAQITATSSSQLLQIYDIVDQINKANIDSIVAKNINNVVVIETTNNSLVIGSGTANTELGLNPISLDQSEFVDNLFVTAQWKEITDPANLKIWVQDNNAYSSPSMQTRLSGYNVYQVFDMQMNITDICQGIYSDDNTMITVDKDIVVTSDSYVMIVNSDSIPNVNGIYKVLGQTQTNSFLIDAYVDSHGSNGKVLLLQPTRFPTSLELNNTITDTMYNNNGLGWKQGMLAYVDYVIDDLDEDGNGRGAVYQCVTDYLNNNIYFEIVRYQSKKTNNYEIKNAIIYNDFVNSVNYLEVFDPAKGLIPGIADKEIDYKSPFDIATYTNSTDQNTTVDQSNYWASDKVGKVWWDMNNAIYLDYEQSTHEYRQSNWGKLYPTGSIDIYEWTKSPFAPDEYNKYAFTKAIIDGIEITGQARYETTTYGDTVYSWTEETLFDANAGTEKTYYYFWVKNKTTIPNSSRSYSINQLSQIIYDPTSFGIHWVAFSDTNTVLIGNIASCVSCAGSVLQINYKNDNTSYHQEYTLIGENDSSSVIPEWLHIGLRDSIVGQDMSIYDFSYTNWNIATQYKTGDVILINGLFYIALDDNISSSPVYNPLSWKQLYSAVDTFDNKTQTNVARVSAPRQVPNIWLHRFARYGNMVSPRQSWISNISEARRILIEKVNRQLKYINVTSEIKDWDVVLNSSITVDNKTYNVFDYWKFVDWQDAQYDSTKKPNLVVSSLADLYNIANPVQGYIVKVSYASSYNGTNNYAIYKYDLGVWTIIFKERGTIQFIDLLWDAFASGNGWDTIAWDRNDWDNVPAVIIQKIIDTLKNKLFVNNFEQLYTELWFTMVKYIISEQNSVDWIVKTTLTDFSVKYALEQKKSYIPDMVSNLMDYFNSVKPFHTKLKNFTSKRTIQDTFAVTVNEIGKQTEMTLKYNRNSGKEFAGQILLGGENWETSSNVDWIDLPTTTTYDYVYDGNSFSQPVYEGWAAEYLPMDITDAARILVTRNTTGSTEDANTTYHIIFSDDADKLEYAKDTPLNITSVAVAVEKTDTSITVTDATKLYDPAANTPFRQGIVWINGERITYRNISGNILLNCTRGTKGTVANTHAVSDIVYSGNNGYRYIDLPELTWTSYVWDGSNETWDSTLWDSSDIPIVKI